ncbi:MAG: hypothetical protein V1887_02095 [Candidatus Aenigmatarchaeota archaeon]
MQTRTCVDAASCGLNNTKPQESQACTPKMISDFGSIDVIDADYSHNGTFRMLLLNSHFNYAITIALVSLNGTLLSNINAPTLEPDYSAWYVGRGNNGNAGDPYSVSVRIDYVDQGNNVFTTGTIRGIRS